jgi:hypothetical protein
MDLEGKWKAILIGGLITGLAPFAPLFNLACCAIPLVGAIVAVAVYRSSQPPPALTNNDGIVLGLMSGLVGTAIYGVLIIPLVILVGGAVGGFIGRAIGSIAEIPPQVRDLMDWLFSNIGHFIGVILFVKIIARLALSLVFGMLGGILGVAIFKRPPSA